jgi:two-component system, chemotaxis family, sensor kinase Cph1
MPGRHARSRSCWPTGYSSDDALPERFRAVPKLLKPFSTEGFKAALRALLKLP